MECLQYKFFQNSFNFQWRTNLSNKRRQQVNSRFSNAADGKPDASEEE